MHSNTYVRNNLEYFLSIQFHSHTFESMNINNLFVCVSQHIRCAQYWLFVVYKKKSYYKVIFLLTFDSELRRKKWFWETICNSFCFLEEFFGASLDFLTILESGIEQSFSFNEFFWRHLVMRRCSRRPVFLLWILRKFNIFLKLSCFH